MMPKIVFMGSPEFAVPIAKALHTEYKLVGIVTQPDKPAGRGKVLTPPAVKQFAQAESIPIIQPEKLKEPSAVEKIRNWQPDLIVVAAYGQILRSVLLELPKFGCINVHASLLPRWRGASPIQAAILSGDQVTGVTIMKMDVGLDTGPIMEQKEVVIEDTDNSGTLTEKLAQTGSELLLSVLPGFLAGNIIPREQDDSKATFCGLIKKDDAFLSLTENAEILVRKIRAYNPWPLARIQIKEMELSVLRAHNVDLPLSVSGTTYIYNKMPAIGTCNGLLVLDDVQKAGKKPVDGRSFLNGIQNWGEKI